MKKSIWPLSMLFALIMIGIMGCSKDKNEEDNHKEDCQCRNANTELTEDNICRCTADFYHLRDFNSSCDEVDNYGICFKKKENVYLMTSDCKCSPFTAYENTAVEFNTLLSYGNKYTITTATSTEGIYTIQSDGNEFEYKNIKNGIPYDLNNTECESNYLQYIDGNYVELIGFMKGKFNAENTFCETKIYWRVDEAGENRDSCVAIFRK